MQLHAASAPSNPQAAAPSSSSRPAKSADSRAVAFDISRCDEAVAHAALPSTSPQGEGGARLAVIAIQTAAMSLAQTSIAALMVSESPAAALQLQHMGLFPETYHPRQICDVHTQIHAGHFEVVWVDIPNSGQATPPRKWSPTVRELALWIRVATASSVPAVLAGRRGKQRRNGKAVVAW